MKLLNYTLMKLIEIEEIETAEARQTGLQL